MKKIIFFIIILQISANLFSQKEVYFTSTPRDSAKVQSLHGFEIESGINTSNLFTYNDPNDKSFKVPLGMGYFNEKRIDSNWTLITRIGLGHNFINGAHYKLVKDSFPMNDSIHYFNSQKIDHYKFEYQLTLGISIEPRWYLDYQYRSEHGNAKLNSGWFLSLPISMGTTLINTYKQDLVFDQFLSYKTYCSFGVTGVVGYRQAISKQLFLEGNCQLINASSQLYSQNNKINISPPRISIFPGINLKVAYTFK